MKLVVFDLGNVVVRCDHMATYRAWGEAAGEEAEAYLIGTPFFAAYDGSNNLLDPTRGRPEARLSSAAMRSSAVIASTRFT